MKLTLVMGAMALALCQLASYTASLQQTRQKAPAASKLFQNFTNKIFHFKIRLLATLKFKDAQTENKKRKNLRGSGERAKGKQD